MTMFSFGYIECYSVSPRRYSVLVMKRRLLYGRQSVVSTMGKDGGRDGRAASAGDVG